jgi:hypothetical protein
MLSRFFHSRTRLQVVREAPETVEETAVIHIRTGLEPDDYVSTTILEFYTRYEDKVLPGLLWLELCRVFYKRYTNKTANEIFSEANINDLKLASTCMEQARLISTTTELTETNLLPAITNIFIQYCDDSNGKLSDNFLTMLKQFLSMHSGYARALKKEVFAKLNLKPVLFNVDTEVFAELIDAMPNLNMPSQEKFIAFKQSSDQWQLLLDYCSSVYRLKAFNQYYKSLNPSLTIDQEKLEKIKKMFSLLEPEDQQNFIDQLIATPEDKAIVTKSTNVAVLLSELLSIGNEILNEKIINYLLNNLKIDATHLILEKNLKNIPKSRLPELAGKLILERYMRKNAACLLNQIARHLSINDFNNLIEKLLIIPKFSRLDEWNVVAFSDMMDIPYLQPYQNRIADAVFNFLMHSSYYLGNYKRWDHLTVAVNPQNLLTPPRLTDVHQATLIALNRLASWISEPDKNKVAENLVQESKDEYEECRGNAYTFIGGLHKLIPAAEKFTLLNVLLDHNHERQNKSSETCQVIWLSLCQLISDMQAPQNVLADEILEKLSNKKCISRRTAGDYDYRHKVKLFFSNASPHLIQKSFHLKNTHDENTDIIDKIYSICTAKSSDQSEQLSALLPSSVYTNFLSSLRDVIRKLGKNIPLAYQHILLEFNLLCAMDTDLIISTLCLQVIGELPQAASQSAPAKKVLLAGLLQETSNVKRVRAYMALGKVAGALSEDEKLIIYYQMMTDHLWKHNDVNFAEYPQPTLFYDATNFELSKALIIKMIEILNSPASSLNRGIILHNIKLIIYSLTVTAGNYVTYVLLPSLFETARHDILKLELLQIINTYRCDVYKTLLISDLVNQEQNICKIVMSYLDQEFTESIKVPIPQKKMDLLNEAQAKPTTRTQTLMLSINQTYGPGFIKKLPPPSATITTDQESALTVAKP